MRRNRQNQDINPFISFTDLLINLVIILGFSVASINIGWEMARYSSAQKSTVGAVKASIPNAAEQPFSYSAKVKSDPPGAQRWVFDTTDLFTRRLTLTAKGRNSLKGFATALKKIRSNDGKQKYLWRRLRIEGHVQHSGFGSAQDMYNSNIIASGVYQYLAEHCGIEPWYMSTAGRGSEDDGILKGNRVEIIVEFQGR